MYIKMKGVCIICHRFFLWNMLFNDDETPMKLALRLANTVMGRVYISF